MVHFYGLLTCDEAVLWKKCWVQEAEKQTEAVWF